MAKPMPMRRPGRGMAPGGDMPKARKGTFPRVVRLLMEDYKWLFLAAMVLMALYSLGNITPSIFIKRISDIILRFTEGASWEEARPEILSVLVVMVVLLVSTIVCNYFYARIMALVNGLSYSLLRRIDHR